MLVCLQDQRNQLDEKMMQNVRAARKDADILLAIVDVSDRPEEALDLLQLSNARMEMLPLCVVRDAEKTLSCTVLLQASGHWIRMYFTMFGSRHACA